jgi:2-polyprenyl-3-methyl-5-hydroxy-6-metoxy-1,4-benzoquinol methylase
MNDFADRYLDWKDWHGESFGTCAPLLAAYFAAETGICARPGLRLLEIGFGNGAFIGWARSIGIEVFGVELSPTLVARARALLGEDRAFLTPDDPGLANLAGTFSHVVAFDVLEHIGQAHMVEFFHQIRALLAAEGRLIVRFPNGDSPFGRIYQHGDPTHVTTLGAEKLRYFAREAGLAVAAIRAPRLPLAGNTISRSFKRGLLAVGRAIVDRAVGLLYFGGRTIPLDPNYVAVLVRAEVPQGREPQGRDSQSARRPGN